MIENVAGMGPYQGDHRRKPAPGEKNTWDVMKTSGLAPVLTMLAFCLLVDCAAVAAVAWPF